MRNPFRVFTRRRDDDEERRAIDSLPWDQGGITSPSKVTMERALRLGPVYAAGDRIAGSIASLPLQVYRKTGDSRAKLPLPPLFASPSVAGTLHDWIYRAVVSLAYRGNAIGLITKRDHYGYATEVVWLHPDWVEVEDSQPSGRGSFLDPIWYYRGRVVSREHILHIPWFVVPGKVLGLSPIAAYASTVNTGLSAQTYSDDWFKSGGVPPGTFKNQNQTVPQDEAAVIKRRLVQSIKTHEPIVYGNDWEYTPISIAPNEAKFIETMKLTATQIAAIYGIPPEMIGGETGNSLTYANVEQQAINYLQFTLLPWLTRLESAFTAVMRPNQYAKFNVDALVRPDASTRYANYAIAREIGLLSIDEIRALEDMPPLPDGKGETFTPIPLLTQQVPKTPAPPIAAKRGHLELVPDDEDRDFSKLPIGPGHALWEYWTQGEGFAKWAGAVHKWTTLHHLLIEAGVPAHEADGLTTNIIEATMPGYLKTNHKHA